jgi:hypothetical protein
VPKDSNPDGLSITEMEYGHAQALKKPRLLFMLEHGAPWSDGYKDAVTGENQNGAKIAQLRARVQGDRMPGRFATPQDLALNAAAALHLHAVDAKSQALAPDLASASCLTVQSSAKPEIIANITRSIKENARTGLITKAEQVVLPLRVLLREVDELECHGSSSGQDNELIILLDESRKMK